MHSLRFDAEDFQKLGDYGFGWVTQMTWEADWYCSQYRLLVQLQVEREDSDDEAAEEGQEEDPDYSDNDR